MNFNFLEKEDLSNGGLLIILCGPPGSGKTTLANELTNSYENFVIISPDEIREELTGDSTDQSHNVLVFAKVYSRLIAFLEGGYNVIYDATNCRTAYRNKIVSVCKDSAKKIFCFMATTSISDCLKYNESRNRIVPEDVIEKMYFTFRKHPPVLFEGYDMIVGF